MCRNRAPAGTGHTQKTTPLIVAPQEAL